VIGKASCHSRIAIEPKCKYSYVETYSIYSSKNGSDCSLKAL